MPTRTSLRRCSIAYPSLVSNRWVVENSQVESGPDVVLAVLGGVDLAAEDRRVPPRRVGARGGEEPAPAERLHDLAGSLQRVADAEIEPGLRGRAQDVERQQPAPDCRADVRCPRVLDVQRGREEGRPVPRALHRDSQLRRAPALVDLVRGGLVAAVAGQREQVLVEALRVERAIQMAAGQLRA